MLIMFPFKRLKRQTLARTMRQQPGAARAESDSENICTDTGHK